MIVYRLNESGAGTRWPSYEYNETIGVYFKREDAVARIEKEIADFLKKYPGHVWDTSSTNVWRCKFYNKMNFKIIEEKIV